MMLEDKLLILKFNLGRREALHDIYERYKNELVTLAAALLTDVALAEDVVHDVFVGFIENKGGFRLTGSLKGYLATCVANNACNRNKADYKHRYLAVEKTDTAMPDSEDPAASVISNEQFERLLRALGQLPYEQREVLVLRTYGNLKFAAIAAQQNVSIHTAQGRYRYALDKLRSILDSEVKNETDK